MKEGSTEDVLKHVTVATGGLLGGSTSGVLVVVTSRVLVFGIDLYSDLLVALVI